MRYQHVADRELNILIVNYHRTVAAASESDGPHTILNSEFEGQISLLARLQCGSADLAAALAAPASSADSEVHLTFDDGAASDLVNARKMAALGITATFFVSSANLGKPGFMSWTDLTELRALGMRIASHSHDHVDLTWFSHAEAYEQLVRSRAMLSDALGEETTWLAFPGGRYNQYTVDLARRAGYSHLFGTDWGQYRPDRQRSASSVIPRNNIVRNCTLREFDDLIHWRNGWRRIVSYEIVRSAKSMLGDKNYQRFRAAAMKLKGARQQ